MKGRQIHSHTLAHASAWHCLGQTKPIQSRRDKCNFQLRQENAVEHVNTGFHIYCTCVCYERFNQLANRMTFRHQKLQLILNHQNRKECNLRDGLVCWQCTMSSLLSAEHHNVQTCTSPYNAQASYQWTIIPLTLMVSVLVLLYFFILLMMSGSGSGDLPL